MLKTECTSVIVLTLSILVSTAISLDSLDSTAVNEGPKLNILFISCHIGTSHKKSVIPLGEHLSKFGGHSVTVFSTFYSNPPIPSHYVNTLDLEVWTEDQAIMDEYVHKNSSGVGLDVWSITNSRNIDVYHTYDIGNDVCKRAMDQHPDVFKRLLDTPWDVIITDTIVAPCGYVISAIDTPSSNRRPSTRILISALTPFHYTFRHVGIPTPISDNYSWQPGYDHRSFWQRLKQAFWFQLVDYYFSYYPSHRIQVTLFDFLFSKSSLLSSYFEKTPRSKFSVWEFDQNSSFSFYQYLDEFGVYRPHLPTDVAIGDLECTENKDVRELNKLYQEFVSDETSDGTIILALGHYVNWDHIPSHVSLAFHAAFRQFPNYRFIWQYLGNLTSFDDRRSLVNTSNILIVDWLPQLQLLYHDKTRLIISQLGLKSSVEIICTSTPILALPTWGEQPLTARLLTNHHQAGKLLNRDLLSADYIANSIQEVVANQSHHKARLDKLREYIHDKPIKSNELARFWIQYSVRNRDRVNILIARGRFLGFPVYFCLDVILMFLLGFSFLVRLSGLLITSLALKLN